MIIKYTGSIFWKVIIKFDSLAEVYVSVCISVPNIITLNTKIIIIVVKIKFVSGMLEHEH